MRRFLFDYIYDKEQRITTNELICGGLEDAIEFIDEHFLEIHADGETEISALRLRTDSDETILTYEIQTDLAPGNY